MPMIRSNAFFVGSWGVLPNMKRKIGMLTPLFLQGAALPNGSQPNLPNGEEYIANKG